MRKIFKGLKKGLNEALAFSEKKLTLKSEHIQIPEPPYKPNEIRKKNH